MPPADAGATPEASGDSSSGTFYANDRDEPAHVHVQRERNTAKFWIDPVRIERSGRFRAHELLELQRIIRKNKTILLKAWDEYFNA
jgi:Domain of unknown function (DUF4160)